MIFALVGNQNCGKTTLFNALTGSNQHVGNFPGVTVDQKMGEITDEKGCAVVDLPGIYSLRPYTQEEIVSRDFILNQKPDGMINIVDATNIERNLYLTLQLLELRIPMVLALNMMDEVRSNGGSIDVQKMSAALGIPVIPIAAAKGEGVSELVDQAIAVARSKTLPKVTDFCADDSAVHRCIHAVTHLIADHADRIGVPARFCATKLIEGGDDLADRLALDRNERELLEHCIVQMESEAGLDRNAALADMRYTFIESVVASSVVKCHESREHARSMKIDRFLTGRYTALPAFLAVMLLIFYLTFHVIGQRLSDWLAVGIGALTAAVDHALTAYGINPVVHSLIIDGIFTGVGSVLVFLFVRKCGIRAIEVFFPREKIDSLRFMRDEKKVEIFAFIAFLIPGTPKDILSYCAGITHMKLSTWVFISTVARFPSVVTSTVGGDALGMGQHLFAVIVFVVTIALSLVGLYFYNRAVKRRAEKYAETHKE